MFRIFCIIFYWKLFSKIACCINKRISSCFSFIISKLTCYDCEWYFSTSFIQKLIWYDNFWFLFNLIWYSNSWKHLFKLIGGAFTLNDHIMLIWLILWIFIWCHSIWLIMTLFGIIICYHALYAIYLSFDIISFSISMCYHLSMFLPSFW